VFLAGDPPADFEDGLVFGLSVGVVAAVAERAWRMSSAS
jgi:hypothetical protein